MISTNENKKPPAAVGAATDERDNDRKSLYTYDYTSELAFCQALLVQVIELADDVVIALEEADAVEAAQHVGMIQGLATALREVLK